jgi:hypothetical protein
MICISCRNRLHDRCEDIGRQASEAIGELPGMSPGASKWCFCQHVIAAPGEALTSGTEQAFT